MEPRGACGGRLAADLDGGAPAVSGDRARAIVANIVVGRGVPDQRGGDFGGADCVGGARRASRRYGGAALAVASCGARLLVAGGGALGGVCLCGRAGGGAEGRRGDRSPALSAAGKPGGPVGGGGADGAVRVAADAGGGAGSARVCRAPAGQAGFDRGRGASLCRDQRRMAAHRASLAGGRLGAGCVGGEPGGAGGLVDPVDFGGDGSDGVRAPPHAAAVVECRRRIAGRGGGKAAAG